VLWTVNLCRQALAGVRWGARGAKRLSAGPHRGALVQRREAPP
jgi:hypothetical protein